jgi:aspartyl-tRNA(Asn)/glutamyl-tRNA(Gln) amidotransferase subunit A
MLTGRSISAPDYFALLARLQDLQRDVCWTLRDVDAFIVPITMSPARPIAEIDADLDRYIAYNWRVHRNTSLGNLLNLCAVSVPCGFTADGLPIGLQIYAKPFQEDVARLVAYAYEQAMRWHRARPDLKWVERQTWLIGGRVLSEDLFAAGGETCCTAPTMHSLRRGV